MTNAARWAWLAMVVLGCSGKGEIKPDEAAAPPPEEEVAPPDEGPAPTPGAGDDVSDVRCQVDAQRRFAVKSYPGKTVTQLLHVRAAAHYKPLIDSVLGVDYEWMAVYAEYFVDGKVTVMCTADTVDYVRFVLPPQ